jgi:hypothetical protein
MFARKISPSLLLSEFYFKYSLAIQDSRILRIFKIRILTLGMYDAQVRYIKHTVSCSTIIYRFWIGESLFRLHVECYIVFACVMHAIITVNCAVNVCAWYTLCEV